MPTFALLLVPFWLWPSQLTIQSRQISQHGSRWLVRYQVRYEADSGSPGLDLGPSDITVDYEAWVSNSRCKPHSVPRKSQTRFALSESNSALATVISSIYDRQRCRERVTLALTTGEKPAAEPPPAKTSFLPLRVAPGQMIWVYVTIEHEHFLYGTHDPLLGIRQLEIRLGPCRLIDSIPLDAEQAPATPVVKLSAPPKEYAHVSRAQLASNSNHLYSLRN